MSLGNALQKYLDRFNDLPDDVRHLPDDGVCEECDRIKVEHPGVDRVLRARGMLYYDEEKDKDVYTTPVPACLCQEKASERVQSMEYAANLPLSVKGARPRSFIAGTLQNFEERSGAEEAFIACQEYIAENTPPILVIRGPRGTGKTHLMEAVGRELLVYGKTVRYERVPTLLSRIRSSYSNARPEEVEPALMRCQTAELLLLDDLGAEKPSDGVREKLFEIVDERYGTGRLLIVSTNESYEGMSVNLGERIASRLFDENSGKVMQVIMTCSDYRRA